MSKIEQNITFPFYAKVDDWQENNSILQEGDTIKVHSIEGAFDLYGIVVNARFGRKKVGITLLEIKPIDLNEEQKTIVEDYQVWFSNR